LAWQAETTDGQIECQKNDFTMKTILNKYKYIYIQNKYERMYPTNLDGYTFSMYLCVSVR